MAPSASNSCVTRDRSPRSESLTLATVQSAKEGGAVGGTGQAAASSAKHAAKDSKVGSGKTTTERDSDANRPNQQNANLPKDGVRRG